MRIYWKKRKRLHKKRVQLPLDWFGSPTWPLFHCLETPIWPPWRHLETLHIKYGIDALNWPSTKACKNGTCKPIWYNYKTWWLKKCTPPPIEPSSLAPKACTHSPKSFWCGKWQWWKTQTFIFLSWGRTWLQSAAMLPANFSLDDKKTTCLKQIRLLGVRCEVSDRTTLSNEKTLHS